MNYTKKQIKEMVLKMMEDLNNDYFYKDEIYITYEVDLQPLWGKNKIEKAWSVGIGIPDFQFQDPLGASIIIYINDETGEIINYVEGPGRPVPTTLKLNEEGKYELAAIEGYTNLG